MDYSLESLALAVEVTESKTELSNVSPLKEQIYQNIVKDLTLQEAAQENVDFKNFALLDVSSRSFGEVEARAGYARAKVYLNEISKSKEPGRHPVLQWFDSLTRKMFHFFQSSFNFINYSLGRMRKPRSEEKASTGNYAAELLLSRAQDNERKGEFNLAASDYRKFISLYGDSANANLATLSLSNIYIRQKQYTDAAKWLDKLRLAAFGSEEGNLAAKLLKKISILKSKERLIAELEELIEKEKSPEVLEQMRFRMALAYLATEQLERSKSIFMDLRKARDKQIRSKSKFYVGWIHKLNQEYGKSTEIFLGLLQDPQINTDLELSMRAQLADIYYKTGNVKQALSFYKEISQLAQGKQNSSAKIHAAWVGFSELEQANIYYFDMKDLKLAKDKLNRLGSDAGFDINFDDLEIKLQESSQVNLRDLAFQILISGKNIQRALELFLKHYYRYPKDSLALAGLATTYILMGDFETAYDYAKKAYQIQPTEYTILMLGYVQGIRENYKDAINKYQEAMRQKPDSVPARFNMACMLMRTTQYAEALKLLGELESELLGNPDRKFMLSKTLNNQGCAYWALGERKISEEKFRQALSLSPELDTAKQNLEQMKRGQTPEIVPQETIHPGSV